MRVGNPSPGEPTSPEQAETRMEHETTHFNHRHVRLRLQGLEQDERNVEATTDRDSFDDITIRSSSTVYSGVVATEM